MCFPEHLLPLCGQAFISLGHSAQQMTNNYLFCTGPKIPHGMILLLRLYNATVLLSSGELNITRLYGDDSWSAHFGGGRYLVKMCDQVTVLISPEHAEAMVWGDSDNNEDDSDLDDESDRLFTFEVAKTKEQEENVSMRPGFQVRPPASAPRRDWPFWVDTIQKPFYRKASIREFRSRRACHTKAALWWNDTGIYDCHKRTIWTTDWSTQFNGYQSLGTSQDCVRRGLVYYGVEYFDESDFSESGAIRLSHSLDENAIQTLVKYGLQDRFPEACKTWVKRKDESHKKMNVEGKRRQAAVKEKLAGESTQLEELLRGGIVDAIIAIFPYVFRGVYQRW